MPRCELDRTIFRQGIAERLVKARVRHGADARAALAGVRRNSGEGRPRLDDPASFVLSTVKSTNDNSGWTADLRPDPRERQSCAVTGRSGRRNRGSIQSFRSPPMDVDLTVRGRARI